MFPQQPLLCFLSLKLTRIIQQNYGRNHTPFHRCLLAAAICCLLFALGVKKGSSALNLKEGYTTLLIILAVEITLKMIPMMH